MTETLILDERAVSEIEAACEALKGVKDACDISQAKPEFVDYILKCHPANISALCATVKHLRAENQRLTKERDRAREDVRILTNGRFIQS